MAGWHSSLPSRATTYDVLAADWNNLVDNLNFLAEVAYVEFTATIAVTATTVGTAQQIASAGAVTYQNAPHLIEFYVPRITTAAQHFTVLRDGATVIGTLAETPASFGGPLYIARRLTPSAASHSYNIAAWNNAAGTTNYLAGTGGTAGDASARLPGFIRVTRIPT